MRTSLLFRLRQLDDAENLVLINLLNKLVPVVAAISLAAGIAMPVSSQENEIEEIVVTAQFREQNLQQTPVAITAVTGAKLEARSQISIADVANQAPNVSLNPAPAQFGPSLQAYIRGVGQSDFSFALEPGVGMYVDDVYYSTLAGSIFDLIDLDRVEILRGPQGTLSGQNSIGGSVKLFSRKPDGEGGGYAQIIYGDYNRIDVRAAAEFTLVEDELFARFAGVSHARDGYVTRYDYACTHPGSGVSSFVNTDSCKLGTEGGKSYTGMRGSFRWLPTDKLEANLVVDYTNDDSEASAFTLLYVGHRGSAPASIPPGPGLLPSDSVLNTTINNGPTSNLPLGTPTGSVFVNYSPIDQSLALDTFRPRDPYLNYSTYCIPAVSDGGAPPTTTNGAAPHCATPINQIDTWGGSLTLDYAISDTLSLKSITATRRYEGLWAIDEDGTPIGATNLFNRVEHESFSQELRLSGAYEFLDYTFGLFYFDQENFYGGRIDIRPFQFIEKDTIPASTQAVFVNTDWHITDAFNLGLGVRYTEMEKTFEFGRLGIPDVNGGAPPPQVAGLNGERGEFEGDNTDYRIVGQYQLDEDIMVYAQYSTGFKSGGVNPRPFFASQVLPHDPETLSAIELGVKSSLFDNMMRLNAAVFLNSYEDILMTVSLCPGAPCSLPLNAGEADVSGLEIEAELYPTDALAIDFSFAYLDFQYQSISEDGSSAGISLDMRAPHTPEFQYSLGIQYEFTGSYGAIIPRLDYNYQDSYFSTAVNDEVFNQIDDHALVNGRVTWLSPSEDWNIALEVTNLTDELYYTGMFDNRGSSRTVLAAPAPPRMWALSMKRNF